MQLTDKIYSYMWRGIWENNANMYYFADPLNILFDPGMEYLFKTQTESLAQDGINIDNISVVINTHCHPDHFEASVNFVNKNIKVGMHKEEIAFYADKRGELSKLLNMSLPEITFDMPLAEGPLTINNTELQIYHTPGHTPGSISIYWPEKKALVCGDALFDHSFGRKDLPGGDYNQLLASIEKLKKLDIEYLMPGHMAVIIGESNSRTRLEQVAEDFAMYV
jgi:glyoxylase-like metal-dependent hydrolase (beta-lactamase superfamily II)